MFIIYFVDDVWTVMSKAILHVCGGNNSALSNFPCQGVPSVFSYFVGGHG